MNKNNWIFKNINKYSWNTTHFVPVTKATSMNSLHISRNENKSLFSYLKWARIPHCQNHLSENLYYLKALFKFVILGTIKSGSPFFSFFSKERSWPKSSVMWPTENPFFPTNHFMGSVWNRNKSNACR